MGRRLSRLRALQAFEAVARNGSFVAASVELHVSPAAVGQQVRALEEWLDQPLFKRLDSGSQRLVLTDVARLALPDLTDGLDRLESGLRRLQERRSTRLVTVSVSQSVAARWLLPRLHAFTAEHPHVDVRLDISDRVVDLVQREADIGLRCGAGRWSGVVSTRLRSEEMFPVCAPSVARASPRLRSPKDLESRMLIHDASVLPPGIFPGWPAWLRQNGVDEPWAHRGLKINSSGAVVHAAADGQGIALARRLPCEDDLATGRLVRLFPGTSCPLDLAYFVVHRPEIEAASPAAAFAAWLRSEMV